MVGTNTYDSAANTLTCVGGTAGAPITFSDLWTSDKAGTFELVHSRAITGADGAPVAVNHALRPTDYFVLGGAKLYITVTNYTAACTIAIVGTDANGGALSENIAVTGNATYNTVGFYRTVTSTQVTVFLGNFTYTLTQAQWGVVYKTGTYQYHIDNTKIVIGDASTTTYFTDINKEVLFTFASGAMQTIIDIKAKATATFGYLNDAATKDTDSGCSILVSIPWGTQKINCAIADAVLYCYSCTFYGIGGILYVTGNYISGQGVVRIWNCNFPYRSAPMDLNAQASISRITISSVGIIALAGLSGTDISDISIFRGVEAICNYWNVINTYRNVKSRNSVTATIWQASSFAMNLVNPDFDVWTLTYTGTGFVYRQYTFDLQVLTQAGP